MTKAQFLHEDVALALTHIIQDAALILEQRVNAATTETLFDERTMDALSVLTEIVLLEKDRERNKTADVFKLFTRTQHELDARLHPLPEPRF